MSQDQNSGRDHGEEGKGKGFHMQINKHTEKLAQREEVEVGVMEPKEERNQG